MHLDQRGHAERVDALNERFERHLLEGGDDEENHVGAMRARLPHLVRGDDEVLAQHGNVHLAAHRVQVGEAPAESPRLRKYGDCRCPSGLVLRRECGRVGDVRELALRRALTLDLGDDRDFLAGEDLARVLRSRYPRGALLERVHGALLLPRLKVFPDPRDDGLQDVHGAVSPMGPW